MKYSDGSDGGDRLSIINSQRLRLAHCYQPSNVHKRPQVKPDAAATKKMAVALPQVIRGYPGQFMIKRPDTADSQFAEDNSQSYNYWTSNRTFLPTPRVNTAREWLNFSDKDYVMPSHVRDVLLSEGVGSSTVEAWLQHREGRHRRAQALQHSEVLRPRRESRMKSLPHINKDRSLVGSRQPNEFINEHPISDSDCIDSISFDGTSVHDEHGQPAEDVSQQTDVGQLSEAEMKWQTEQQQEQQLMQNKTRPRLVLISSKIPRCRSMTRAVRKDAHVLALVYDFESWSFSDIIGECQLKLDEYMRGCKAQSILIFCNGGPGYMYLLRNYVLTPQKLRRPPYHSAKEFWYSLGQLISKLSPDTTCIHLIGCQLKETKQGERLRQSLQNILEPNKVKVEAIHEDDIEGRVKIGLYFNYRKYLLWRSKSEITQGNLDHKLINNTANQGDDDVDE
ncbi:hypothetical protein Btru_004178 [Bulinus truncatus]|nr:hypothetical protein Btru_004178 [Bulinus truncatus]